MNIDLPSLLRPTKFIPVTLTSGTPFQLPYCCPTFPGWTKPTEELFSFNRKPFLDYRGTPVFAELYVLRLLQEHGWDGVWVSSFGGRKYLHDIPVDAKLSNRIELEAEREAILDKIAPRGGGCFDVFAWRGADVVFCECKRHKGDDLQDTQYAWIDDALRNGQTNLLIVEWDTVEG